jgi:hypothetical protein
MDQTFGDNTEVALIIKTTKEEVGEEIEEETDDFFGNLFINSVNNAKHLKGMTNKKHIFFSLVIGGVVFLRQYEELLKELISENAPIFDKIAKKYGIYLEIWDSHLNHNINDVSVYVRIKQIKPV